MATEDVLVLRVGGALAVRVIPALVAHRGFAVHAVQLNLALFGANALLIQCDRPIVPVDITTILATKTRTHRVVTAPPQGLFLIKVFY